MNKTLLLGAALLAAALLGGCTREPPQAKAVRPPQAEAVRPLRIGIMPDVDSLPLMVAEAEGLFAAEQVAVELLLFQNPNERSVAFQAGQLDGIISDLANAAQFAAGGFDSKITSLTDGRYGVAGSPALADKRLEGLRGKRIGLSAGTLIQYTLDIQLAAAGIGLEDYEPVPVPQMPLRIEMVLTGQLEAVSLPEPLLTAAVERGAVLLSTTDGTDIDAGVLLFRGAALDSRLDAVRAFYRAYYRAAEQINANPGAYRDFLVEKAGFAAEVRDAYRFVRYRKPTLPTVEQINRVLVWLKARGIQDTVLNPEALLDQRIVAEW
ncbi:MAG: ABC transporter substrate-binding protein [Treponema sp.]|nr:ABC transporter substrate-binding protein [Treponema sp.]